MTKHEAALMLCRILDDDYASLTDKVREALQMGIDALEEEDKRESETKQKSDKDAAGR